MKKLSAGFLVLTGIIIGWAAAAARPSTVSQAEAKSGSWGCYVADRLPDAKAASDWAGAIAIRQGLDQVAGHVHAGTILSIAPKSGGYVDVICVKN